MTIKSALPPGTTEGPVVMQGMPHPNEQVPPDPLAGLVRGRIVLYAPHPYEARNADPGPWPAMVVHVGPLEGQATLVVFLPVPTMIGGDPVARRVEVPYSANHDPGSWSWMFDGQGTSRGKVEPRP